jgi:hypothetical protein
MLCHEYQCIFVHIPKTAGQSIEHVFVGLLGRSWETRAPLLLRPNDDPKCGPPRLAHLKAAEYVSCDHVSQPQFDSYFKFSFVRNPWDRIVSAYKYKYAQRCDFKTYLFKQLPTPSWSNAYCHIIPQYEFLYDAEGKCLVDFVGKFERLQEDFDQVCTTLGIPNVLLPHVNKSLEKDKQNQLRKHLRNVWYFLCNKQRIRNFQHYTEYYDDESKEFVAHLFQKDIEIFNYEFERLQCALNATYSHTY